MLPVIHGNVVHVRSHVIGNDVVYGALLIGFSLLADLKT